jgi:hypothetical protein
MGGRWLPASAILACAVAATGLVIALSGCSGSSAVSSVVDPVAQAAQVSELAPGFKASLSEEIIAPGSSEAVTASGTGTFDQRDHRGIFSVQGKAGEHSFNAETQYSDLALYMRLPSSSSSQASSITHGKPWIKLDLRGVSAALGINFSALTDSSASSNPGQLLSYLKAASGQVTRIGAEQVQGVPTTHYRATIEYDRYAGRVAPAQRAAASQSVAALERLTGTHSQLVDVWVDGQHRVRREELTFHECLPGVPGTSQIHLQIEFSDFGVQAMPAVPPSSEVADITSYVAEKLKHVKLGCSG